MSLREALDKYVHHLEICHPNARKGNCVMHFGGMTNYFVKLWNIQYDDAKEGYFMQKQTYGQKSSNSYFENIEALELTLRFEHFVNIDKGWNLVSCIIDEYV